MSLRDQILNNPACADALARRDCDELARIVSVDRVRIAPLAKHTFAIWCARTGIRAVIEDHAINAASPLRSIALTLRDFLVGPPDAAIDFSADDNMHSLMAWQAAGAITVAQKDDLIAMSTVKHPYSAAEVAEAVFQPDGTLE